MSIPPMILILKEVLDRGDGHEEQRMKLDHVGELVGSQKLKDVGCKGVRTLAPKYEMGYREGLRKTVWIVQY